MITFKSIDKTARTATFDVDGESVTRKIPLQFKGTIDDYLSALARGLQVEVNQRSVEAKAIETPTVRANAVMVEDSPEPSIE